MPLNTQQRYMVIKALRKYFGEQLWMIKGYADFVMEYGVVPDRLLGYATAICNISDRMKNWAINYVKKMFNMELPPSEAEDLVWQAMENMGFTPKNNVVISIKDLCTKYKLGSREFINAVSKLIKK